MKPIRLAVVGCTGRVGSAVVRLAMEAGDLQVAAALTGADDPRLGQDAGVVAGLGKLGVTVSDTCDESVDVLVDFSTPAGCRAWAAWCEKRRVPMVSGTTGLGDEDRAALYAAANETAVLWSPNMSVGVNLLIQLVSDVAGRLGEGWDIEISETHHRRKVDAPSGTAKALYEAACKARNLNPDAAGVYGREGMCGPRKDGEIGVHALRMGGVVGEHSVHFATPDEVLILEHRAFSREMFAAGALKAARWIVGRPAGVYQMRDALFGSQP